MGGRGAEEPWCSAVLLCALDHPTVIRITNMGSDRVRAGIWQILRYLSSNLALWPLASSPLFWPFVSSSVKWAQHSLSGKIRWCIQVTEGESRPTSLPHPSTCEAFLSRFSRLSSSSMARRRDCGLGGHRGQISDRVIKVSFQIPALSLTCWVILYKLNLGSFCKMGRACLVEAGEGNQVTCEKPWQGTGAVSRVWDWPPHSPRLWLALKGVLQIPSQVVSGTCPGSKVMGTNVPHPMVIPGAGSTG